MAVNPMDVYLSSLGEEYEKKTGKTISIGEECDITDVINFYGGTIEYADLYEDVFKLDSIIYRNSQGFRIVVDEKRSEQIKSSGIGSWNLFMLDLFYFVVATQNDKVDYEEDIIIHPRADYAEAALIYKEIIDSGKNNDEAKRIAITLKHPCPPVMRKQYVKRLETIRNEK